MCICIFSSFNCWGEEEVCTGYILSVTYVDQFYQYYNVNCGGTGFFFISVNFSEI
jgi:hypothetical protein